MADNYLAGKTGFVTIGSTSYSFAKWKSALKTALVKVTNFTTAGYQLLVAAITSATLTVEGPYNEGNMAFTAGVSYTWVLGFTTMVSLTISAFIEQISVDNDVEGAPRVEITAQSSGSFTAAIV